MEGIDFTVLKLQKNAGENSGVCKYHASRKNKFKKNNDEKPPSDPKVLADTYGNLTSLIVSK